MLESSYVYLGGGAAVPIYNAESGELALQTRQRSAIRNFMDRSTADDGRRLHMNALIREYPRGVHRDTGPCATYNCHGLTFGSRRTAIHASAEIQKILKDDDYEEVSLINAEIGDIVVYFHDADPQHSGIVVEKFDYGARILSKWGHSHEVIHMVGECPYNEATSVKYYRVIR